MKNRFLKLPRVLSLLLVGEVLLMPVVGPLTAAARASVITTGDVNPGPSGTQPDAWILGGNLCVAEESNGTLNISDGGVVNDSSAVIGDAPGATGVAMVTGSGSQWNNSGILFVDISGNGTLNVEARGRGL